MKKQFRNYINITIFGLSAISLSLISGCGGDDPVEDPDVPVEDNTPKVIVDPSMTHQEMIGFGGAITWYCERVTSSAKKDEIINLIVDDLEVDIVRLKNWYYPLDYPLNKSPDQMELSWFKPSFDATNEIYDLLKQKNPSLKILFSSWGPPSSLKSNGELQQGTLKKENDSFVYDAYATYWQDVMNHITFSPDYLSIQNEPSYVNEGWETCAWRPSETFDFPGYDIAFDKVYEKLKDRNPVPKFIGPESANLGNSSFGNTFSTFANAIKDKAVEFYAYHPYNFNDGSVETEINSALNKVRDDHSDKPNVMTEYSGMSWFKNAQFMYSTLTEANSSGYIYWELIWDATNDRSMIKMASNGDYELSPYYYQIKHFSKSIHNGDHRAEVVINNSPVKAVAFINPGGDKVAIVILNPLSISLDINLEVKDKTVTGISGWQSTEDNLYQQLSGLSVDEKLRVPSESLTTVELEL